MMKIKHLAFAVFCITIPQQRITAYDPGFYNAVIVAALAATELGSRILAPTAKFLKPKIEAASPAIKAVYKAKGSPTELIKNFADSQKDAPNDERYALSSAYNAAGATFLYLSNETKDELSEHLQSYGRLFYEKQKNLTSEHVTDKKLRTILASATNLLGSALHFYGGLKGQSSTPQNQDRATKFHNAGDYIYNIRSSILRHNGNFSKLLDGLDFNKKSHVYGTILLTMLTTYTAYKLWNTYIYSPSKKLAKTYIFEPSSQALAAGMAEIKSLL